MATRTKDETMTRTTTTMRRGNRVAHIDEAANGHLTVSVWYDNGHLAARWFKGFSTCSNDYKSRGAAERAAHKFLNH